LVEEVLQKVPAAVSSKQSVKTTSHCEEISSALAVSELRLTPTTLISERFPQEPRQGVAQQPVFGQKVDADPQGQLDVGLSVPYTPQFHSSLQEGETPGVREAAQRALHLTGKSNLIDGRADVN